MQGVRKWSLRFQYFIPESIFKIQLIYILFGKTNWNSFNLELGLQPRSSCKSSSKRNRHALWMCMWSVPCIFHTTLLISCHLLQTVLWVKREQVCRISASWLVESCAVWNETELHVPEAVFTLWDTILGHHLIVFISSHHSLDHEKAQDVRIWNLYSWPTQHYPYN
jgi:hypothetical protein